MSPFHGPAGNTIDKFETRGPQRWAVDRFNRRAADLVHEIPGSNSVLDVGCREGKLIHYIASRGTDLKAVGIDADDPKLRTHWENLAGPRLRFQAGDVENLPFPDNTFQIVTAFSMLEHLPDPDRALREIRRVCSGWLVASVPWEPWWRISNVMLRGKHIRDWGNTPGHVQHWTRRGFRELMREHGRVECLRGSTVWSLARIRLRATPSLTNR